MKNKRLAKNGFTLVELLVVMTILGILATVTLGNFRTSQIKARDAQRKHDLRQIANALEAYYGDHATYPLDSNGNGQMEACGCGHEPLVDCNWNNDLGEREFCDVNYTVYMSKVPGDPTRSPNYCYLGNGVYFQLYARLENSNDPDAVGPFTCGSRNDYNFGVASPNCTPEEADPTANCL